MAHEDLLSELRLEDKKLEERDFVKIEIAPKDVKKVSRNREDWTYKVDEERTLPNWYDENIVKCQKACWKAWEESISVCLAVDKEEKSGKDQLFFAYGSATVEARGSATVVAYGSATVVAYGSAKVEAYDSAKVEAYDSATVIAYGSATVELKSDYATVLCHRKIFVTEKAIVIRASVVKAAEV